MSGIDTQSDKPVETNAPCTARTGVGIGVVSVTGVIATIAVLLWWFG